MSRERHPEDPRSPWWGEHLFRYEEAVRRLAGDGSPPSNTRRPAGSGTDSPGRGGAALRVLDAACGTAFGTRLIRRRLGTTAVGLDVAVDPLRDALTERSPGNAAPPLLVAGDVSRLPFGDACVDAVTSFETLEHTPRFRSMLAEIRRVLRPGGRLFLSTPNRPVNSPRGVENPFHTQEFDPVELEALLREHFGEVRIFGQRYTRWDDAGLRSLAGPALEALLLTRGIRKLPLEIQDRIIRLIGAPGVYPTAEDFGLEEDPGSFRRCRTLYAVCRSSP